MTGIWLLTGICLRAWDRDCCAVLYRLVARPPGSQGYGPIWQSQPQPTGMLDLNAMSRMRASRAVLDEFSPSNTRERDWARS